MASMESDHSYCLFLLQQILSVGVLRVKNHGKFVKILESTLDQLTEVCSNER